MKWTDVKPSKPGWYWNRLSNTSTPEVLWLIGNRGSLTALTANGMQFEVEAMHGQWSDAPIAEPEGE